MSDQNDTGPKISVIIASVNGPDCLHDCLDSMMKQDGGIEAEIIVTDCCGEPTCRMVAEKFPSIQFHQFEERKTIPELRAFGMLRAKGEIVVITEDHCVAPPDWYQQIVKGHAMGYDAVGGAVENAATDRLIDWAVFFCEYLRYMNPIPEGESFDIPGNNASYKRAALDEMRDLLEGGFWEAWLTARLIERGKKVYQTPDMIILHKKNFGFGEFMSQRYHYARSYAGMRNDSVSFGKRLFYILFSPCLPPLIIYRMIKIVRQKKRGGKILAKAMPLLMIFSCSWAVGEWIGYVFGPGDSLRKVE